MDKDNFLKIFIVGFIFAMILVLISTVSVIYNEEIKQIEKEKRCLEKGFDGIVENRDLCYKHISFNINRGYFNSCYMPTFFNENAKEWCETKD